MRRVELCPACGSGRVRERVAADAGAWERYLAYSAAKYGGLLDDWLDAGELCIDRCQSCGHHWYRVQPDPDRLTTMYASGRPLNRDGSGISRAPTEAMLDQMRRLFELIGNRPAPTLLDYGSGFGRWARAAVSAGFEVTAYEPAVERGAESDRVGFMLVHDRADLAGKHFDAINLEQVLEHVPDPLRLLYELHPLCSDDTLVRITVPNVLRCPEGRQLWNEWPYNGRRAHTMAPFEHLHGFTPKSLRLLAGRAGFVPVPLRRLAKRFPLSAARRIGGGVFPALDQTFLMLVPAPRGCG